MTFSERRTVNRTWSFNDRAESCCTRPRCPAAGSARGLCVRGLAGGRRTELVAGPAARASRRRRVTVRIFLGVRRLERFSRGARTRTFRRRELAAYRRANAYWIETGAGGRERRRPGAVRPRMVGVARVRGRARHQADRRRPDLRRAGQRRPPGASGALLKGFPGRSAARPARTARAALGQSAVRLGRAGEAGLPLVDRAAAADVRAVRPCQSRSLSRFCRLLGDSGRSGRARRSHRPLGCRPRRVGLPGGRRPSSASCP